MRRVMDDLQGYYLLGYRRRRRRVRAEAWADFEVQ
jgi:hypothetical protein